MKAYPNKELFSTVSIIITLLFIITTILYLSAPYLGFERALMAGTFFTVLPIIMILSVWYAVWGIIEKSHHRRKISCLLSNRYTYIAIIVIIILFFIGFYVGPTFVQPLGYNGEFVFFGMHSNILHAPNYITQNFVSNFAVCSATILNGDVVGGTANFNRTINAAQMQVNPQDVSLYIPFGIDGDITSLNLSFVTASINPVDYVTLSNVKIYKLFPTMLVSNLTNVTIDKYHTLSGEFTSGEYVLSINLSFSAHETNSKPINENYTIFTIIGNTLPNNKIIFGYSVNLDLYNSSNFTNNNC